MKINKLIMMFGILYTTNVFAFNISCEEGLKYEKFFSSDIFYSYISGFKLGLIFGFKDASEVIDSGNGISDTDARANSKALWSPIKKNLDNHSNDSIGLMVRDYCRKNPNKQISIGVRYTINNIGYNFDD